MADTEAFDLIAEIKAHAVGVGGTVRDETLAFDHGLPDPDTSSFIFANAHILTIGLPSAFVARTFLKEASAIIQRLLDRSSIRITVEIGGGRPAKLSLNAGIEKARATLAEPDGDEDSSAD